MAEAAGKLNVAVLKYATEHLLKKVATGECAELADAALASAKAMTVREIMGTDKVGEDTDYEWGDDITLAEVEPGDIVQVRNYKVKWSVKESDGKTISGEESESHHTAIISSIVNRGNGIVKVLHQNSPQGKIVVQQELWFQDASYDGELNYVEEKVYKKKVGKVTISVSGTLKFYRPKAQPPKEK